MKGAARMFNPRSVGTPKRAALVVAGICMVSAVLWLPSILAGAQVPQARAAGLSLHSNLLPAAPTSTPVCGPAWRLVASPNIADRDNTLSALAALSSDDV